MQSKWGNVSFWHTHKDLLRLIFNGRIEGKKLIGREERSWIRNLLQRESMTVEELLHVSEDRVQYRKIMKVEVVNM